MPVPAVKALARKAGKSVSEAERLWNEAKKSADEQGKGKDYAYIMGTLKSMLGLDESTLLYRVVLEGDRVVMVRDGVQVHLGESKAVDAVRGRIQELVDADVDGVYEIAGFTGTLPAIEERIRGTWLLYVVESSPRSAVFARR
jgi:hypothetical protein